MSETVTTALYNGRGGADVVSGMASSFAIANLYGDREEPRNGNRRQDGKCHGFNILRPPYGSSTILKNCEAAAAAAGIPASTGNARPSSTTSGADLSFPMLSAR